jgi:hypothetical protein|uniref:VWFA domain-containing protein n=1 Tax=Eutreptiella gymnastica TaxID=73025 RepID=A0A7S4FEE0_9EUGL
MSAVSPHQTFSSMEEYRAWKASQEGAATTPATTTTVSARTTTSGYATTATRGFSPRAYDTTVSSQVTRSVHTLGDGTVVEETTLTLHFFECVASAMDCNYIVIVDRSSSMRSGIWDGTKMATRWDEAREALKVIAPAVTEADPDGVTVYFFSDSYTRFASQKTAAECEGLFESYSPQGGTELHEVLAAAIKEHKLSFEQSGRYTRILVVHDGEPANPSSVMQLITDTANSVRSVDELRISFIQCGDDAGATQFLDLLDSGLKCRYDIVDTLKWSAISAKGFAAAVLGFVKTSTKTLTTMTLHFFKTLKAAEPREYIVIIDRSYSMQSMVWTGDEPVPTRWSQALDAVKAISPVACNGDPNGITMYFFSDEFTKHTKVTSAGLCHHYFGKYSPLGGTELTPVLEDIFNEHFSGTRKPTTVLVVHDGEPASPESVKATLRDAANKVSSATELLISFIQVGGDKGAAAFLDDLDCNLGARFDIVDTMSVNKMKTTDMAAWVSKTLAN